MGIALDWFDKEETTLIWQFAKEWTNEDFYGACEICTALFKPQNQSLNLIMDFTDSVIKPKDCLSYIRQLLKESSHNLQDIYVICPSNFWRKIFLIVIETANINRSIRFMSSLDEMYQ